MVKQVTPMDTRFKSLLTSDWAKMVLPILQRLLCAFYFSSLKASPTEAQKYQSILSEYLDAHHWKIK